MIIPPSLLQLMKPRHFAVGLVLSLLLIGALAALKVILQY